MALFFVLAAVPWLFVRRHTASVMPERSEDSILGLKYNFKSSEQELSCSRSDAVALFPLSRSQCSTRALGGPNSRFLLYHVKLLPLDLLHPADLLL